MLPSSTETFKVENCDLRDSADAGASFSVDLCRANLCQSVKAQVGKR